MAMNETCLIFFADKNFTILSDGLFSDKEKSEIISKALPKGSYWKLYTGERSIAYFTLQSSQRSALIYSVITDSITIPAVNFIILLDKFAITSVLRRKLTGIQSAYFRTMGRFYNLDKTQANLLVNNLLSFRTTEKRQYSPVGIKSEYDYIDFAQWRSVENSVINVATNNIKNLLSFRTLSLKTDGSVQVAGVVRKSQ